MPDFSYLLGAQTPQIVGPMQNMVQGMSLADAAFGMQQKQLQLAATTQYNQAVQALGSGQMSLNDIAQNYPMAYAKILQDQKALQLTQAQIGEAQGKGAEASANAFKANLGVAADMANGVAQKVQAGQPLSTMDKQQLGMNYQHAMAIAGFDPSQTGVPTVMAPDSDWANFASNVANTAASPQQQAEIYKLGQMTPVERQKAIQEGNAAQSNANTAWQTFLSPPPSQNAVTGTTNVFNRVQNPDGSFGMTVGAATAPAPQAAPSGQNQLGNFATNDAAQAAAQAAMQANPNQASVAYGPAPGQPVQTGKTLANDVQMGAATDRAKTMADNAAFGARLSTVITSLGSLIGSGYNGALAGSPQGKDALNVLQSLNMLTPEQATKLANTRAGDALTPEILGPVVHELSSRGSNMALTLVQQSKPDSMNSLQSRQAMLAAMAADARNLQTANQSYQQYIQQNPTDITASGWRPPAPTLPGKPAPPQLGDRVQGYIYKGGDPSLPSSWDK